MYIRDITLFVYHHRDEHSEGKMPLLKVLKGNVTICSTSQLRLEHLKKVGRRKKKLNCKE